MNFFLKIFAEKFGTSKKVLTFATRLRNNGKFIEVLREKR
jgi:hypothetical protein